MEKEEKEILDNLFNLMEENDKLLKEAITKGLFE